MSLDAIDSSRTQRTLTGTAQLLLALHIDGPLFIALCMVGAVGSIVLFSASGSSLDMLEAQLMRFALGLIAMIMLAQVPPRIIRNTAPIAYIVGLIMLSASLRSSCHEGSLLSAPSEKTRSLNPTTLA